MKLSVKSDYAARAVIGLARHYPTGSALKIEELAAEKEFDRTVVNDFVERAADELVGLLGSSFLTPAQAPEH